MEQAITTTINNSLSSSLQQKHEWKDDPLQMLAKQCDTISGDEDKINKQQMGNKRQQKYLNGNSNNNDFGGKNGQNKIKVKSPNKLDQTAMPNVVPHFMPLPNGFGLSHPMQLAAAAFLHPLMPTQRPPTFIPSNNFCPPNSSPFTSPAQLHFMQQLMAAAVQQQQQLPPPPPPPLPPTNLQTQQQLPPNFLPMFPQQHPQNPSGIPLPANMPVPARKLDQRPPSANNQFNNNNQNSDIEAATLAMAMFQQQQNNSFGQGLASNGGATITQQTVDNSLLAQQILQQPIPALLMAAACGQLPSQFACPYRLREGQPCGRLFNSDDQLFAHYKSAHIAQMSSPSAVSSTTEGPAVSTPSTTIQTPTTTAANGRPKITKNSPTGVQQQTANNNHQSNNNNKNFGWYQQLFQSPLGVIPTQPFLGPPLSTQPPPPQPTTATTMIGTQNHRFHPYAQPTQVNQQITKSVQMPPPLPSFQQQMALALNLMANSEVSSLQQFAQNNNNNIPPPPPPSELNSNSQLAALAAMANSLGGNNQAQIAGSN
uniref:C2H2-type domain-containing protein n=1 Tax=Meloidogyne incognita TaxID=6306 RepID=A0A914MTV9_MELIC